MDDTNSLTELLTQAFNVFATFKNVGLLAGLVLLVNLLVNVTKLSWFEKLVQLKPFRPWLAVGLGLVGGVLTALVGGHPADHVVLSALTGAVAGLGSVGVHELGTKVVDKVKSLL